MRQIKEHFGSRPTTSRSMSRRRWSGSSRATRTTSIARCGGILVLAKTGQGLGNAGEGAVKPKIEPESEVSDVAELRISSSDQVQGLAAKESSRTNDAIVVTEHVCEVVIGRRNPTDFA